MWARSQPSPNGAIDVTYYDKSKRDVWVSRVTRQPPQKMSNALSTTDDGNGPVQPSKLVVVSYHGLHCAPLTSAIAELRAQLGGVRRWRIVDCPLYAWRNDPAAQLHDYIAEFAALCADATLVLFWYHKITPSEMSRMRALTPARVRFALYTWDDPYDWHCPLVNMRGLQAYFDGGVATSCGDGAHLDRYTRSPARYAPPGYIPRLADRACAEHTGRDRFVCDVCVIITNLYDDVRLYTKQRVPRRALIDALYALSEPPKAADIDASDAPLVLHVYSPPGVIAERYPHAYRGQVPYENLYGIMRTCRVCLSTHVCSTGVDVYMNERVAIALGSGALLLSDLLPEGVRVGGCALPLGNTVPEAVNNVRAAVRMDYVEAECIREAARAYAQRHLTWKSWAREMAAAISDAATIVALRPTSIRGLVEPGGIDWQSETIANVDVGKLRTVCVTPLSELPDGDPVRDAWTFDVAVSIGRWCLAAHQLRMNDARVRAFPFDWIFSTLDAVVRSVPNDGSHLLVLDEFMTPERGRTEFAGRSASKDRQALGFPHFDHACIDNVLSVRRACDRWQRLLHDRPDKRRSVLFLHTARPHEYVVDVRRDLQRFDKALSQHCAHVDAHVLSVWHQEWREDDSPHERVNRVVCVERGVRCTIFIARVSCGWDGDNWAASQQTELWNQVLSTFDVRHDADLSFLDACGEDTNVRAIRGR